MAISTVPLHGGVLVSVTNDNDRDNLAPTLLVSYSDLSGIITTSSGHASELMFNGIPLSISVHTFIANINPSVTVMDFNNIYYTFDIIENNLSEDIVVSSDFNLASSPSPLTVTINGNRLSASKIDGRYYLNVSVTSILAQPSALVTMFNGMDMALGNEEELVINDTLLTLSDVDELIDINIGGAYLTAGRVGFKNYLIVKPLP